MTPAISVPGAMALREYQQEAITAVTAAWLRGIRRPLIALPTGSGKTVVFAHLASYRRGRTLILAHRDELIQQAAEKLAMVDPTLELGIVKAGQDEHEMPVVVASVQTLSRTRRLERVTPDFQTIIIDEGHHAWADSYRRILTYCRAFEADGPLTLGVTATPERGDHESLGEVFQEVVYAKTIVDLIPTYLCDLRAIQVMVQADFRELHSRAGDIIDSESERLLLQAHAPMHVARSYYEHAVGRKALIFTPTVRTAYAMVNAFEAEGDVPVEALDGTTPLEARRAILQRFHRGDTMVLSNCLVLGEGYDEPSVDCVIIARPTKSKGLYAQMIGRGCRHYPGKADCLVVDVVGASQRFDLMTFAGLFDIKPEAMDGQTLTEAMASPQGTPDEGPLVDGRLIASPVDLFRSRELHWVIASQERFALPTGKGLVYLEPMPDVQDRWRVRYKAKDALRETLREGLDLGYAQGFAEDYARQMGAGALVNPDARWRRDPATEGQVDLLRRCRIHVKDGLTKGEATDLIAAASLNWN
jgi:superfamily II DNA or RNA helicase